MSIANLETGIRNEGNQKIQRAVAVNKDQEWTSYSFNGSIVAGGATTQFIFNTTLNEGTIGYLPQRVGNDLKILEAGIYLISILIENIGSHAQNNKYRIFLVDKNNPITQIVNVLFDLDKKTGAVADREYRYNSSQIYNFDSPVDLIINGNHIDGTEAGSKDFRAFIYFTRLK